MLRAFLDACVPAWAFVACLLGTCGVFLALNEHAARRERARRAHLRTYIDALTRALVAKGVAVDDVAAAPPGTGEG